MFQSASGVRERLRGCGLFPCSCVVELWLAVLHIGSGGRGFWGHVTSILQEKLEGSVGEPRGVCCCVLCCC